MRARLWPNRTRRRLLRYYLDPRSCSTISKLPGRVRATARVYRCVAAYGLLTHQLRNDVTLPRAYSRHHQTTAPISSTVASAMRMMRACVNCSSRCLSGLGISMASPPGRRLFRRSFACSPAPRACVLIQPDRSPAGSVLRNPPGGASAEHQHGCSSCITPDHQAALSGRAGVLSTSSSAASNSRARCTRLRTVPTGQSKARAASR